MNITTLKETDKGRWVLPDTLSFIEPHPDWTR